MLRNSVLSLVELQSRLGIEPPQLLDAAVINRITGPRASLGSGIPGDTSRVNLQVHGLSVEQISDDLGASAASCLRSLTGPVRSPTTAFPLRERRIGLFYFPAPLRKDIKSFASRNSNAVSLSRAGHTAIEVLPFSNQGNRIRPRSSPRRAAPD